MLGTSGNDSSASWIFAGHAKQRSNSPSKASKGQPVGAILLSAMEASFHIRIRPAKAELSADELPSRPSSNSRSLTSCPAPRTLDGWLSIAMMTRAGSRPKILWVSTGPSLSKAPSGVTHVVVAPAMDAIHAASIAANELERRKPTENSCEFPGCLFSRT